MLWMIWAKNLASDVLLILCSPRRKLNCVCAPSPLSEMLAGGGSREMPSVFHALLCMSCILFSHDASTGLCLNRDTAGFKQERCDEISNVSEKEHVDQGLV